MALLKCYECTKPVSDQAPTCPHCGAPARGPGTPAADHVAGHATAARPPLMRWPFKIALGVIGLLAVFGIMADKDDSASKSRTRSKQCADGDLQCLGNKGVIAAGVYCKSEVEKRAKHSVRWIDGTFEMKFSRFRWSNKAHQEITYVGDKAEFQNGFGAYTRVVYECDLDPDNKTVLGVRVREGRLDN